VRDSALLLVPALIIAAVYVLHFAVAIHEAHGQRRRRDLLTAAAAALDGAIADGSSSVTGLTRGLPATFSLNGNVPRVDIDVAQTELILIIQPRLVPARAVDITALRTGDERFDAEMTLEGAPADVVRCLLGRELRARLMACRPLEVVITGTTVEITGEPCAPAQIPELIELAAALAAAVPAAVDEADRRLTRVSGSPYRPVADASAVHTARAGRAEEVATLLETLRDRSLASRRALVLAAVLAGFLLVSLYASG
jgi:hypothetical protein